jgi:hypothetical protein
VLFATLLPLDEVRDSAVAFEVVEIEAEDLAHLMDRHRSDDSGIVDLNSRDSVLKYES